jgi:amino acid adenylation domain-containing protein
LLTLLARHGHRLRKPIFTQEVTVPIMADSSTYGMHPFAPLSFAQQRLWFLDRYEAGHPVFHHPLFLHLKGPLNREALERSLNALLRRHDILRTSVALVDDQPVSVILPATSLSLGMIDLTTLPESRRAAEATRQATNEARQPFDLTTGPLFRAALWRIEPTEHLLLLTTHHMGVDRGSMRRLAQELAALYTAFARALPFPFSPPAAQYAEVAQQQRERLQGETLETLVAYWRHQLADTPPLLVLPTDHPRPAQQSYRGARASFHLGRPLSDQLCALSEREGVTLFMTLLAAFNVLLSRTSGQTDLSVGSPMATNRASNRADLIGPLATMRVLRTDLSGNPTFRSLLGQVHAVTLGAAHHDLPFEKLVEILNPAPDPSHTPLFQASFLLDEAPLPPLEMDGLHVTATGPSLETAAYDLSLEMTEGLEGLTGWIEYSTDLFDEATITRVIGHFQTLLEGIVAHPDQTLLALPLLTAAERRQVLVEWNQTQTDHSFERLAHQIFEEQATRTPDAIAARDDAGQVRYEALNRRANRLARHLVGAGVGPDVVVALLAERNIDFLTTMLAVFKAGGAYLPLDPLHPAKRYHQTLSQSQSRLVLTTQAFVPVLSQALDDLPQGERPQMLLIEDLLGREEQEENLPLRATLDDLAYVIYTSGSTGIPKGAMVEQRGMLNHLYAKIVDLGLTERDVLAETASQCFDISVWQFLAALLVGGTVDIFNDDMAHDARHLLRRVQQRKITILETVPSLLRAMLEEKLADGAAQTELPSLRWLIPTGEALPPELCRQWLRAYPQIPMLNAYGPTECSDDVTHYPIYEPPAAEVLRMPIGRPIINMRMYVLDALLQPVPIGVIGELYVGGIGVGRGYLNAPNKTAEAFIADPFASAPGARLYKTGDLARYLPDGNLEFIGRADYQVKIRGFRIEPGEIEAALEEHPAVQQALVLAKEGPTREKHLVAYVVPETPAYPPWGVPTTSQETQEDAEKLLPQLRSFLKDQLPDYMVPSAFVILQAMPLNANGKIDRKALPEPEITRDKLESAFVAPNTPLEESIAGIWANVLGIERVGIYDHFLELGGHSLLAVRVLSKLAQIYQIELPLRSLFEAPTVAALANLVEQKLIELVESLSEEEVLRRLAEK